MNVTIASGKDYTKLVMFYASYFPAKHPLFHFAFWDWMFANPDYGKCIIVENEQGEIIGHVGAVKGGSLVWLVNILIDKNYSGQGVVTLLFEKARQFGPLAVAVANEAGSALLQKKKWIKHANLRRMIWVHPSLSNEQNGSLFNPLVQDFELPKVQGYFWQQPFLESLQFPWGDTAVVSRKSGGIRWVTIHQPALCISWAMENNIGWMDWVGDAYDITASTIVDYEWKEMPSFPWFLDPLDQTRKVELNLFTEQPLPTNFRFLRIYADMTRVGMIS